MTSENGPAADFDGERDSDLFVDENSTAKRVAERLREAIDRAGGPTAVSAKSGVKGTTLRRLLNGQEAKQEALVALANACRVSLEWLATGRGEPNFGWTTLAMHEQTAEGPKPARLRTTVGQRQPSPAETRTIAAESPTSVPPDPAQSVSSASKKPSSMFATIDMTRLGNAMRAAASMFEQEGLRPSWRRLAQSVAIIYDAGDDAEATIKAALAKPTDD